MFYPLSKALAWIANPADWAVLLVVAAAVLAGRRVRMAASLAVLAAMVAAAFSSPFVADSLLRWLESSAPNTFRPDTRYDAAIVLGGSDVRVAGGADVVRSGSGRHLLYTGRMTPVEARQLLRQTLAHGVPGEGLVIADRARNTYENAVESFRTALRLDPNDNTSATIALCSSLAKLNENEEAAAICDAALHRSPFHI